MWVVGRIHPQLALMILATESTGGDACSPPNLPFCWCWQCVVLCALLVFGKLAAAKDNRRDLLSIATALPAPCRCDVCARCDAVLRQHALDIVLLIQC